MKLYITGSVGSGKSTLARKIGEMGLPCFELDAVAYEPDPDNPGDNRKRPETVRDAIFAEILARESWVMEDAGRTCFVKGMKEADQVILLEPAAFVRDFRILRRWLRQRAGKEACRYRPDFLMLRLMFRWRRNYDSGKDDLKKRLEPFAGKLVVLRREKEVQAFLGKLREEVYGGLSGVPADSGQSGAGAGRRV